MLHPDLDVTTCQYWHEMDRLDKNDLRLQNTKIRTARISLAKLHFSIAVFFQNISSHLAVLHLKITMKRKRKDKYYESGAVVYRNQKNKSGCKVPYFPVIGTMKRKPKRKQYPSLYCHHRAL